MKKIITTVLIFLLIISSKSFSNSKRAIIVGASSGIGEALVEVLSKNGYEIGITARRLNRLETIAQRIDTKIYIQEMDVTNTKIAREQMSNLIKTMGGVKLVIINAGVGFSHGDLDWDKQKTTIDVNVTGFTAIANVAINYFFEQKKGHLVGISSIAALRGGRNAATYCASKAYVSTFLEGLRNTMHSLSLPIYVTDIQPGYVDTDLVKQSASKFWVATSQEAAEQIFDAVKAKRNHAYVTSRWRLIAWLIKWSPDWLYDLVA